MNVVGVFARRDHVLRLSLLSGCAAVALALTFLTPGLSTAANGDWTQFGHDAQRTGFDPGQPPVTGVALDWTRPVDGAIYAQPLVFDGRVYVATEDNAIYAFDAQTGAAIWHQTSSTLGAPATDADLTAGSIHCSNLGPTVGITGTPVIDPSTGRLYAVAQVRAPSLHYVLWTLDLASGNPVGPGQTIDPWALAGENTPARAIGQQQRPALLLAGNYVYVGFGARVQGCGTFNGWLAAVPVKTGIGGERWLEVPAEPLGGSIWSPAGAVADSTGTVWVATGGANLCRPNCQSTTRDLTESVLKLAPASTGANLELLDSFTPANWVALNNQDLDVGVTSPILVGNGLVFQLGKTGIGYLLNASNLGHSFPGTGAPAGTAVGSGTICSRQPSPSTGPKGSAAWVSPDLYVACPSENVKRVHFTFGSPPAFSVAAAGPVQGYVGPTIVSGGVVWDINPTISQVAAGEVLSATLNSFDAKTMQTRFAPIPIRSASGETLSTAHFAVPASAEGHIYVGATGQLVAYRLVSGAPGPVSHFTYTNSIAGAVAGYDPQTAVGIAQLQSSATVTVQVYTSNPADVIDWKMSVGASNVRELRMTAGVHVVTLAPVGSLYSGPAPIVFQLTKSVEQNTTDDFTIAVCSGSHATCTEN
jgi:hypothetical protein